MKILLGSLSPRRKELLGRIVDDFTVYGSDIDETQLPGEEPADYSVRISRAKALGIAPDIPDGDRPCLLITSDTIVTIDGMIIGKPGNREEAVQSLALLQGRAHSVISGITMTFLPADPDAPARELTDCETTAVTFKSLAGREIEKYLDLIEYRDKAGAYAIQEHGDLIIEGYSGSLSNIIGFPLRLFLSMAVNMGLVRDIFFPANSHNL